MATEAAKASEQTSEQRVRAAIPSAVQDGYSSVIWFDDERNNHTVLAGDWDAAMHNFRVVAFERENRHGQGKPKCGKFAGSMHPRLGMNYACVLDAGHDGDCQRGGTCFKHGPYVGANCPQLPDCTANVAASSIAPEKVDAFKEWWRNYQPIRTMGETNYLACAYAAWNAALAHTEGKVTWRVDKVTIGGTYPRHRESEEEARHTFAIEALGKSDRADLVKIETRETVVETRMRKEQ